MDLAKSGGLEIKGPSDNQPVAANSSSKDASLTLVGQPLPGVGSSKDASIVAMGPRLPTTHVTVTIRFPHGDVRLPWFVVDRHPMFAEMFEDGILQWPGASQRQARIITHYLRAPGPNYRMVSCEPLPHEERLEREFTDALAINAQATSFNLLELAGLALAHMETYGDMISLTRIMINFMAQGEWYQRNRCYVQDYVTRRFTSTYPMAMHHDRRRFGLQTGDPLIDGLLGAINGLRFPDLPFPPYPHHYY
ncbi:hypothetical protein Forpe1208_v008703 [Fusarium oxysporum f. sp. rapae]|uniref:Uncharacterized protein n=1 Tax=Fusarium oxysporum f. sp. rapae TaxID=485398 RepID=A0A8J5P0P9_FUSOX|nr:hypothetical protein Forpe1208_v008703 [Fusarium oxysporum f. sp. rapae]